MNALTQSKLEKNLLLTPFIQGIYYLLFMQPIIIFYYQSKGITIAEFFYLQPVFSISIIFFGLFCGHLSDVWGRKKSLILSSIMQITAVILVIFADNIWQMVPATFCFALSFSLFKSTLDAMLFDTLSCLNREQEHKKILGKSVSTGQYFLAISAILSGFMFTLHVEAPAFASIVSGSIFLTLTLFLTEPPRHQEVQKTNPLKDIAQVMAYILKGHHELKWLILFMAVISVSCLKGFWTIQPLAMELGVSVILVGVISSFYRFVAGLSSQMAHKIEHKVKLATLYKLVLACSALSFFCASFSDTLKIFAFVPLLLIFMADGFHRVIATDLIQQRTTAKIRGKVLAVEMIVQRFFFSVITPIFGYIVGAISLQWAMIFIASYTVVLGGTSYIMLKKARTF